LSDARILVVGDLNIDIIVAGLPELPRLGTERVGTDFAMVPGGSATNMACTLAALGAKVSLIARVGHDSFGDFLVQHVSRVGVDTTHILRDPDHRTGVTVALACGPDRAFATFSGAVRGLAPEDIDDDVLRSASHVHIAGYYLVPRLGAGAGDVFARARDQGCTTSLDTGFAPSGDWQTDAVRVVLPYCDYFLPNEVELAALTGIADPIAAAQELAVCGCTVVAKLGGDGAAVISADGEVAHQPPYVVEPLDTTGCGDAFNAAFIKARVEGMPVADSLRLASACGALCATRLGGSEVIRSADEVAAFAEGRPG